MADSPGSLPSFDAGCPHGAQLPRCRSHRGSGLLLALLCADVFALLRYPVLASPLHLSLSSFPCRSLPSSWPLLLLAHLPSAALSPGLAGGSTCLVTCAVVCSCVARAALAGCPPGGCRLPAASPAPAPRAALAPSAAAPSGRH